MTRIVLLSEHNQHLLERIAPGVFDGEIQSGSLQVFLTCPRHSMALAVSDDLVVGIASAVEYFHPDKRPQLWINEVGVSPDFRGRGIGRQLVETLVELAGQAGCTSAWLGTATDNTPAQRCFSSVRNADGPEPFVMYEWQL